jgi:hypothetical protein
MTGPQDAYDSPLSALRDNVENLGAWLAIWEARSEPDAHARRCANDAVDAIDTMLRGSLHHPGPPDYPDLRIRRRLGRPYRQAARRERCDHVIKRSSFPRAKLAWGKPKGQRCERWPCSQEEKLMRTHTNRHSRPAMG